MPAADKESPTIEIRNVGGLHTEVLELISPEPESSDSETIVVLPGNPGGVGFYVDFAVALGRASRARVIVVGHASHSASTSCERTLSLPDQVAHKLALLRAELAARPGTRFALVGHSVGAYMAAELARELPSAVVCVAGLMPTLLDIGATPRGQQLAPLFTRAGVFLVCALSFLLRALLPRGVLRVIAARVLERRSTARASPSCVEAAVELVHERVAANALVLARTEMALIREMRADTASALRRLGVRCALYFADADGWNSPRDARRLAALLPEARIVACAEGHTHSFVVSQDSVGPMARIAAALVLRLPRPEPATSNKKRVRRHSAAWK
jgi:pimeloyl-ACP methyl ester carboxylesterase